MIRSAGTCQITIWQGEQILFLKGLSTAFFVRKVVKKIWQLILCGWSSSEKSNNNAWNVNSDDGNMNNNNKDNNKSVSCLLALENKQGIKKYLSCRNLLDYDLIRCACFVFKRTIDSFFVRKVVKKIWQLILCDWSSSEYNNNNAWNVKSNDDNVDWNNKNNNNSVSCLLALENRTIFCCRNLANYGLLECACFVF